MAEYEGYGSGNSGTQRYSSASDGDINSIWQKLAGVEAPTPTPAAPPAAKLRVRGSFLVAAALTAGLALHNLGAVEDIAYKVYTGHSGAKADTKAAGRQVDVEQPPVAARRTLALAGAANVPEWFIHDLKRKALWLPPEIQEIAKKGRNTADYYAAINDLSERRLNALPYEAKKNITDMNIPRWMVALIPSYDSTRESDNNGLKAKQQIEIERALSQIGDLSGPAPKTAVAQRVEQLALFAGAAQLPTVGNIYGKGEGLMDRGCAATLSKYVYANIALEYPQYSHLGKEFAETQMNVSLKASFDKAAKGGLVNTRIIAFDQAKPEDVSAGSHVYAQKSEGGHSMIFVRPPKAWGWTYGSLMAVANTGLPDFRAGGMGRMVLAQEYIDPYDKNNRAHNQHGTIFSQLGGLDSDPRANPYFIKKTTFSTVEFK